MIPNGVYTGHAADWWPDRSKAGNAMIVLVISIDGRLVDGHESATEYEREEIRFFVTLTENTAELNMEILKMLGWSGRSFHTLDRHQPGADVLDTPICLRVETIPGREYPNITRIWERNAPEPQTRAPRPDPAAVTRDLDDMFGGLLADKPQLPGEPF